MYEELRSLYTLVDNIIGQCSFERCTSCNGKCCRPDIWQLQPAVSPGERYLIEDYLRVNNLSYETY